MLSQRAVSGVKLLGIGSLATISLVGIMVGSFLGLMMWLPFPWALKILNIATLDVFRIFYAPSYTVIVPLVVMSSASMLGLSIWLGKRLHASPKKVAYTMLSVFIVALMVSSVTIPSTMAISATQTAEFNQFNEKPCSFYVFTDGTNYYAQNCDTGAIAYGGPGNAGGATETSAQSVVQSTINTATSTTGPTDIFAAGQYTFNTKLTLQNFTTLKGAGNSFFGYDTDPPVTDSNVVFIQSATNTQGLISATTRHGITITGIKMIENQGGQGNLLDFNTVSNLVLSFLSLNHCAQICLSYHTTTSSDYAYFSFIRAQYSGEYSKADVIQLNGVSKVWFDHVGEISGAPIGKDGIDIIGSESVYVQNSWVDYNKGFGIESYTSKNVFISRTIITNNQYAGIYAHWDALTASILQIGPANQFTNNGINSTVSAATRSAIQFANVKDAQVFQNIFFSAGGTQQFAVAESTGASTNQIYMNNISKMASATFQLITGTDTVYQNTGYNPVGHLANPFDTTGNFIIPYTIGSDTVTTSPTNSTTTTIAGTSMAISYCLTGATSGGETTTIKIDGTQTVSQASLSAGWCYTFPTLIPGQTIFITYHTGKGTFVVSGE